MSWVLGPHPLPDSIKDERLESVGKKFTWRKNKHRVECGGDSGKRYMDLCKYTEMGLVIF